MFTLGLALAEFHYGFFFNPQQMKFCKTKEKKFFQKRKQSHKFVQKLKQLCQKRHQFFLSQM